MQLQQLHAKKVAKPCTGERKSGLKCDRCQRLHWILFIGVEAASANRPVRIATLVHAVAGAWSEIAFSCHVWSLRRTLRWRLLSLAVNYPPMDALELQSHQPWPLVFRAWVVSEWRKAWLALAEIPA